MHEGACHCGAAPFRIEAEYDETPVCDCSYCRMRNARMAEAQIEAVSPLPDEAALKERRFETGPARRVFCGRCGVYAPRRGRDDPGPAPVGASCLEAPSAGAPPQRRKDGAKTP